MSARPSFVDPPSDAFDPTQLEGPGPTPYYVALGQACDWIFRCADCKTLVVAARLRDEHACSCGCRKMTEVRGLSLWERLQIVTRAIDFPHRREFLAEFPGPIARWRARRAAKAARS